MNLLQEYLKDVNFNPTEIIMIYKVIFRPAGIKASPPMTRYYFSKNAKDKIEELTIYNKSSLPRQP